jgi:group I intron endonuclease
VGLIYKLTNIVNNKIYIGCTTTSLNKRFNLHIRRSKNNKNNKLYNSIRKYGIDNFTIEQIEECENDILFEREIYYINLFDTYNNGLNSTLGGEGCLGYHHTEETKELLSNITKENRKNISYVLLYGEKSTIEKDKRSESLQIYWNNLTTEEYNIRIKNMNVTKHNKEDIKNIKKLFSNGYKVKDIHTLYPTFKISYLYDIKSGRRCKNI